MATPPSSEPRKVVVGLRTVDDMAHGDDPNPVMGHEDHDGDGVDDQDELPTEPMMLNMGPSHPATHGFPIPRATTAA